MIKPQKLIAPFLFYMLFTLNSLGMHGGVKHLLCFIMGAYIGLWVFEGVIFLQQRKRWKKIHELEKRARKHRDSQRDMGANTNNLFTMPSYLGNGFSSNKHSSSQNDSETGDST